MPDIRTDSINGPFMFIHEVTGTYVETDNYNDNVNEAIQTWNLNPLSTTKGQLGHLWYVEPNSDGSYLIKSYENNRCLTASATAAGDFPRLQEKDGGIRQQWIFRRVHDDIDSYADSYAIMPSAYPGYALAPLGNNPLNNVYVVPTPMWDAPPSLSQYWKVANTPKK
jgi:hypothetical protein